MSLAMRLMKLRPANPPPTTIIFLGAVFIRKLLDYVSFTARTLAEIYTALNKDIVNYYAVWGSVRYGALLRNS